MAKRKYKPFTADDLNLPVVPPYKPRFMTEEQMIEMVNLWHLSKVPFCDFKETWPGEKRMKRMGWTADEMAKKYPAISRNGAYKDLEGALS